MMCINMQGDSDRFIVNALFIYLLYEKSDGSIYMCI